MKRNVKIVVIDNDYCEYLRKYDKRVYEYHDKRNKRPYIGVLFEIDDLEYFAPLSSPKVKHYKMNNSVDFHKIINEYIKSGKREKQLIGVINFNNMIPVTQKNYEMINFKDETANLIDKKYLSLLYLDFIYINENFNILRNKAQKLYCLFKNNKLGKSLKNRCCDFTLLEEKCKQFNEELIHN